MKNHVAVKKLIPRLEKMKDELERIIESEQEGLDALQDRFDDKSEAWQESDKGQEMDGRICTWADEIQILEDCLNEIDTALQDLGAFEFDK